MTVLLDTHVFLWWAVEPSHLSPRAGELIADPEIDILVSTVIGWEIAIKSSLGRLRLDDPPSVFVPEQVLANGFRVLPVEMSHALHVASLPPLHKDPFDRLLIAQAQIERVPLVSADSLLAPYPVEIIW